MSYDYDKLSSAGYTEFEIEALQEISNIGVGHAATALSQLLHRRVDMSIPHIELVNLKDLAEKIAGSLETVVAGILVDTVDGDNMLNFVLVFDEKSTKNILNVLKAGDIPDSIKELDEISLSIVKETGNILLLHTISAINSFTETKWFPFPPQLSIDMVGAIVEELVGREKLTSNYFLLVDVEVFTKGQKMVGHIIIIHNNKVSNV